MALYNELYEAEANIIGQKKTKIIQSFLIKKIFDFFEGHLKSHEPNGKHSSFHVVLVINNHSYHDLRSYKNSAYLRISLLLNHTFLLLVTGPF